MPKIRLGKYSFDLPQNRLLRIIMGVLFILGGFLGFLPILGFWMVPLGFVILAQDIPIVRRMNRRIAVRVKRWWTGVKSKRRAHSA